MATKEDLQALIEKYMGIARIISGSCEKAYAKGLVTVMKYREESQAQQGQSTAFAHEIQNTLKKINQFENTLNDYIEHQPPAKQTQINKESRPEIESLDQIKPS